MQYNTVVKTDAIVNTIPTVVGFYDVTIEIMMVLVIVVITGILGVVKVAIWMVMITVAVKMMTTARR